MSRAAPVATSNFSIRLSRSRGYRSRTDDAEVARGRLPGAFVEIHKRDTSVVVGRETVGISRSQEDRVRTAESTAMLFAIVVLLVACGHASTAPTQAVGGSQSTSSPGSSPRADVPAPPLVV